MFHITQSFLDTYEVLRNELVNDSMLEGQPVAAQEWLKEVRIIITRLALNICTGS
jgi:hypothetical protein